MSRRMCSNSNPRGSTSPEARPQNMKASSGSGLWPRRINTAARAYRGLNLASEEPALERAEELLPRERPDVLGTSVVLRDPHVVVEDVVRVLDHVLELVSFEDVVVRARRVA